MKLSKLLLDLENTLREHGDLDVIDKNLCDIVDAKYIAKEESVMLIPSDPIPAKEELKTDSYIAYDTDLSDIDLSGLEL